MSQNTQDMDAFLEELKELLDEPAAAPKAAPAEISDSAEISEAAEVSAPAEAPVPEKKPAPVPAASAKKKKKKKKKYKSAFARFMSVVGKIFLVLQETVLLLAVALYGVMYVLAKGPSPAASELFVRSVRETSAIGFLANLYLTEAEITELLKADTNPDYVETDTSLIQIPQPSEGQGTPDPTAPDDWGLVDEDGDGIIVDRVYGEGFNGYMMIVLDPSRVILGSVPTSYGGRGFTVEAMVERFDAVAGINAGGFHDPNGSGNGSIPDTTVVFEGKIYYPERGNNVGFVGIDSSHILHVGNFDAHDLKEKDIQYGVSFGPILIANGEICDGLDSGVNPRTAIGQRSDGAMLLLVVDGRQASSLGATYGDLAEVFADYGAVNAYNLDGGSSTVMWHEDRYINNCASVKGVRPVPTAFVVLKEGVGSNG